MSAFVSSALWLTSFSSHDLDSFKEYAQVFCRVSLNLGLSDVLIIRLRLWGLGKNITELKCPSHLLHIGDSLYPYDITVVIITMVTWLSWYLPHSSTVELLLLPFRILFFGKSLNSANPQGVGMGEIKLYLLEGRTSVHTVWNSCQERVFSLLFIYLFESLICVNMDLHISILWVVI